MGDGRLSMVAWGMGDFSWEYGEQATIPGNMGGRGMRDYPCYDGRYNITHVRRRTGHYKDGECDITTDNPIRQDVVRLPLRRLGNGLSETCGRG